VQALPQQQQQQVEAVMMQQQQVQALVRQQQQQQQMGLPQHQVWNLRSFLLVVLKRQSHQPLQLMSMLLLTLIQLKRHQQVGCTWVLAKAGPGALGSSEIRDSDIRS
jgi:hypothetical protein